MNKLVSIVIPVYKTEKYLRESVSSAIGQTYANTEIILVDDGSPDNCPKICDEIAERNKNTLVIHKKNGGLSSARNCGIEKASGDYIIFLDSDDILSPKAVSDMVEIAEAESSDAVIPNTYYKVFENDNRKVLASHFTEDMFCSEPKSFALDVLIGKGRAMRSTAVLYNLRLIKQSGISYPVGKISEDFFFNLSFFKAAAKISLYKEPSLYNLKRECSITASYHDDFFETVLEMDDGVQAFISAIDSERYKSEISGKRETLLFKNVLVFAIKVMGDKNNSFCARRRKCIEMFKNERFTAALHSSIGVPYFNRKIQRFYMRFSNILLKHKLYSLTCFFSFIAAKANAV